MKTILTIALLAVFLLSACTTGNAVHEDTVRIGVITGLSGHNALLGSWSVQGLEIAKDEINANGGINGKPIEILYEDSEYKTHLALNAAKKLIDSEHVDALITQSGAGATLSIAPYATEQKTILMEILCVVQACQTKNDFLFRISGPPDDQLKHMVQYAHDQNMQSASVLYINNEYGKYQQQVFLDHYKGNVLAIEAFDPGTTDFRAQITKAAANNPDVIFIISFPREVPRILNQLGELGITIPSVGTLPSQNQEVLTIAKEHAEGHVYAYFATNFSEGIGKRYSDAHLERFGKEPEMWGAKTYDALYALSIAMSNCEDPGDAECVSKEIYDIQGVQGVSDIISFNEYGDLAKETFEMKIIKDGQFQALS